MQTFFPYEKFHDIARCLDFRRLNAQVNEAKAILTILEAGPSNNYYNHPAVQMWRGYEPALHCYRNVMLSTFYDRGGAGSRRATFSNDDIVWPAWKTDERLHHSHRAMLYRKLPYHYKEWERYAEVWEDYFWPTKNGYDPPLV